MHRFHLLTATLILSASPALAQTDARFIAVDGHATVSAAPDLATLRMAVSARNLDLDAARDEVVRVTRAFLAFSDDEDIDNEDVQTSALSITPEYRWNRDENRQEMIGYLVQRNIVVRLEDIGKLGDVLEGAVTSGVNQVQPPELGHTRERDLRREALAAATQDARANAEEIARSLGVRLDYVRQVSATQQVVPQPRFDRMAMVAQESGAGAGDTYNVGEITIEASVTAEFGFVKETE